MSATELLQDRYGAAMMLTYGVPPVALARGERLHGLATSTATATWT